MAVATHPGHDVGAIINIQESDREVGPVLPHIKNYRYELTHPETGEVVDRTRVTTLVKALEDPYNLNQWEKRLVAKGLTLRRDLFELAGATPLSDKKSLDKICWQAKEAARGSEGANLGTALHKWSERYDRGEPCTEMSTDARERIGLYTDALRRHNIKVRPEYMERTVLNDVLGTAGTTDRLYEWEGRLVIGDLKTAKDVSWSYLSISAQLAAYAYSDYILVDPDKYEWVTLESLGVSQMVGLCIHIPSDQKVCAVYTVDLEQGWEYAKLAYNIRESRKDDGLLTLLESIELPPRDWESEFLACTTADQLNSLGMECSTAGELTEPLRKLAIEHRHTLTNR